MLNTYSSKTTLTQDDGSLYLTSGQFTVKDIAGAQVLKVKLGTTLQFTNLTGNNQVYLEGSISSYSIKGKGKAAILLDNLGGSVHLSLTKDPQTLVFADGVLTLGLSGKAINLTSSTGTTAQTLGKSPAEITLAPGTEQTSQGSFDHAITLFDGSTNSVKDGAGDDVYGLGEGSSLTLSGLKGSNVIHLQGFASDYKISAIGKKVVVQDAQGGSLTLTLTKTPQQLIWADESSQMLALTANGKGVMLGEQTLTKNAIVVGDNLIDSVILSHQRMVIDPNNEADFNDGLNMPRQGIGANKGNNTSLTQSPTLKSITLPDPQQDKKGIYASAWSFASGTEKVLSYSFAPQDPQFSPDNNKALMTAFVPLSADHQALAVDSLQKWGDLIDVKFVPLEENDKANIGDIRWFGCTNGALVGTAKGFPPSEKLGGVAGDIWVGPNIPSDGVPTPGSYAYLTFLHELGHTLGLLHPAQASTDPQVILHNQLKYTIMSYNDYAGDTNTTLESAFFPTTPMLDDTAALQALYGANSHHNNTDNVYAWESNQRVFETIWDTGGTDTLDGSNQEQAVALNLNPGEWSTVGKSFSNGKALVRDCLTIAYGVDIENAIGSRFNDTLIGNALSNILRGNAGSDTLAGNGGADTFVFESNASTNGQDTIADFSLQEDQLDFRQFLNSGITVSAAAQNAQNGLDLTQGANVGVLYNKNGLTAADIVSSFTAGKVAVAANGSAVVLVMADTDGSKVTSNQPVEVYFVQGLDNAKNPYLVYKVADLNSLQEFNASDWINSKLYTSDAATYQLTTANNVTSVIEGNSITFNLATTNISNGTVIPYTLTGIQSADINGGLLSGSLTVNNNVASVTLDILNDQVADDLEILKLTVGNKLADASVVIKDAPPAPTYAITTANNVTSVIEGSSVTFNLATTNVSNGTVIPYTLTGVQAADVNGGQLSGYLTVNNNAASLTLDILNDKVIEVAETLGLTLGANLASKNVQINDAPPTYTLTTANNVTSVIEGNSVTFNLATTNVSNGTVIPYSLTGFGIQLFDVNGGQLSGYLTVNNNAASLTLDILNDQMFEDVETLNLILGNNLASQSVQITDSPSYRLTIANNVTSIIEGNSVTFNLATTNVSNGTAIPYTLTGIQAADVTGGQLSGYLTVNNNAASVTLDILNDQVIEGFETLGLTLGANLASQSVQINDALPTYVLTTANNVTSVIEGNSVTFNLATTNVSNGTAIPYTLTGIQSADITGGQLSGYLTVNNNAASLTLDVLNDQVIEGVETLGLTLGANLASNSVLINDPPPSYTLTTANAVTSVIEGNSVTFNLATTNISNGTVIPYTLTGIQAADVNGGQLSGTLTVNNNVASLTLDILNDQVIESVETLGLTLGANLASNSVLINDPSSTYTLTTIQPYFQEGDTVRFTLTTTNVSNGTVIPYNITGIQLADLNGEPLSGSLTVNNNSAILTLHTVLDSMMENGGAEVLNLILGDNLVSKNVPIFDPGVGPYSGPYPPPHVYSTAAVAPLDGSIDIVGVAPIESNQNIMI